MSVWRTWQAGPSQATRSFGRGWPSRRCADRAQLGDASASPCGWPAPRRALARGTTSAALSPRRRPSAAAAC
eukprot:7590898-Lingulodinium_polyedra.AAC.1